MINYNKIMNYYIIYLILDYCMDKKFKIYNLVIIKKEYLDYFVFYRFQINLNYLNNFYKY